MTGIMEKGWFIVPRKAIADMPPDEWQLYTLLLYYASYADGFKKNGVALNTGHVGEYYQKLGAKLGITGTDKYVSSRVSKLLKKMEEKVKRIGRGTKGKPSVLSINDFSIIQSASSGVGRQSEDKVKTNGRPNKEEKTNKKQSTNQGTQSTEGTSTRDMILRAFDKLSSQSETIAPCKEPSVALLKAIDARLKVHPGKDFWSAVFAELKANSYYHGNNDKGYVVTLGYLMQKGNAERVLQRVRQVPEETGPSCPKCKGAKEVDDKPCPRCDGRGYLIVKGR